jgi:putative phosphonate metabolism protein
VIGAPRPEARLALYWAPELDDPLHALGSAWLGRDAETGAPLPQPALPGLDIAELTADPRGYGLHATLKPPFRPALSWAEVMAAAEALAARVAPFDLPPLAVFDLDGFLALRETAPCPALRTLADAAVEMLDRCRQPPGEAELARRRRSGLSPRQEAMLQRWGYPYVFEEWRFHVTLTRRLTPAEKALVLPAVTDFLDAAPSRPRRVEHVVLFTQSAPGQPFRVAERLTLKGPHVPERMA